MKKFVINATLIVIFVLLIVGIALPFLAEVEFKNAKRLEGNYRWMGAGEKYQAAIHLNPFNAEYFAATGNFLLSHSEYRKGEDKISWLKRAEKLYGRACQLNPQYAEYRYLLGKTKLRLEGINSAIGDFKKAIEKDPYNFRNNYLIGHNLLTKWNALDVQEKNFALDRLRYTLRSRPWYGIYVYPAIMYYVKDFSLAKRVTAQCLEGCKQLYSFMEENNLWQYRRELKELVDFYRQKEQPQEFNQEKIARLKKIESLKKPEMVLRDLVFSNDWKGKSMYGENTYKNGNMYWTGTMYAVADMPEGEARISIVARGTPADGVFPYMIVEIDGKEIGEAFVDSPEWEEYSFDIDTDGGIKVLSVTFANDGWDKQKNEDRNLYVGKTRIARKFHNHKGTKTQSFTKFELARIFSLCPSCLCVFVVKFFILSYAVKKY